MAVKKLKGTGSILMLYIRVGKETSRVVDSSFREGCWIYSRYKYEAVDIAKRS